MRTIRVWPLIAAVALFAALLAVAVAVSMRQNGGHLVYALDDPYIHMAMAKNVATHHVWGVSASHFTSSSSSLLWTGGLALLFAAVGVHASIPFLVNAVLAVALLAVAFIQLSREHPSLNAGFQFAVLAAIVFVAPLPAMVLVGQEHILHALVNLAFVGLASSFLNTGGDRVREPAFRRLCALALCLPLIRFEALFAIAAVSLLLVVQRRWRQAVVLAAVALIPVGIYGVISASLGWFWLPNSVLLKGARPDLSSWQGVARALGYVSYSTLINVPALAFLMSAAIAAFLLKLGRGDRDDRQWMLGLFIALTLLHTQFAQPPAFWFFRYEAYLIVLGCAVIGRVVGQWMTTWRRREWSWGRSLAAEVGLVLLFVLSPLTDRGAKALAYLPQATTNIYEQQYQMGLFLKQYYEGMPVAMNDIGAASFLADIECVDLAGLANMDAARRRLRGFYESEDIQDVVEKGGAQIAIVYDSWFGNTIPATWRRAGSWSIRNNVVGGSDTVTFYAIQPRALGPLRLHLDEFLRQLPPTVAARFE